MLSAQAVRLYWRYSLQGGAFREPIGVHHPSRSGDCPRRRHAPAPREHANFAGSNDVTISTRLPSLATDATEHPPGSKG
jgi:hypothetical protein